MGTGPVPWSLGHISGSRALQRRDLPNIPSGMGLGLGLGL